MKAVIDIPRHQIEALSEVCQSFNISRAEAVRQAIALFVKENKPSSIDVFGTWDNKEDGLTYQKKMREEW